MANETKHTPGPWYYNSDLRQVLVKDWKNNPFMGDFQGCVIADLNAAIGHQPEAHSRDFAIPQAEANARLIAAAPELLAVLKAWVEAEQDAHFEEQAHDAEGCRYCESVAAIAKAEGRQ